MCRDADKRASNQEYLQDAVPGFAAMILALLPLHIPRTGYEHIYERAHHVLRLLKR
jgi:hypothetical protein